MLAFPEQPLLPAAGALVPTGSRALQVRRTHLRGQAGYDVRFPTPRRGTLSNVNAMHERA